jgi:hypothetical protein
MREAAVGGPEELCPIANKVLAQLLVEVGRYVNVLLDDATVEHRHACAGAAVAGGGGLVGADDARAPLPGAAGAERSVQADERE